MGHLLIAPSPSLLASFPPSLLPSSVLHFLTFSTASLSAVVRARRRTLHRHRPHHTRANRVVKPFPPLPSRSRCSFADFVVLLLSSTVSPFAARSSFSLFDSGIRFRRHLHRVPDDDPLRKSRNQHARYCFCRGRAHWPSCFIKHRHLIDSRCLRRR